MTDDELFDEFFRRVADAVLEALHITVCRASRPFTITWAIDEAFLFDPAEARREGLDGCVGRAVATIRLWREGEGPVPT